MKKRKYIVTFLLFIIMLSLIIIFFINEYNKTYILNDTNRLLEYLYSLNEGIYDFNNGSIYKDNELVINKYYLDGTGKIEIDKYGNIKFYIDSNNKCISKTALGEIEIHNNKCDGFVSLKIEMIRNNSKISFNTFGKKLDYLVSKKDNFKGKWISSNTNDENIIINRYNEDDNYIWFKDKYGNLSDVKVFNVECLDTNKTNYDSSIFYCSGSTVLLDDMEWIVLEDTNTSIKLMKYLPLNKKMSYCMKEPSEFCYYTDKDKYSFKWSNSYINYYLNNEFINKLSEDTKKRIVSQYICDDYDLLRCNNESCGGYNKDEIEYYNWNCNSYIETKIKTISYDEYNYLYLKSKNKKSIKGKYWAINSYKLDKASTTQSGYEFYILENPTSEIDVKPVITINK